MTSKITNQQFDANRNRFDQATFGRIEQGFKSFDLHAQPSQEVLQSIQYEENAYPEMLQGVEVGFAKERAQNPTVRNAQVFWKTIAQLPSAIPQPNVADEERVTVDVNLYDMFHERLATQPDSSNDDQSHAPEVMEELECPEKVVKADIGPNVNGRASDKGSDEESKVIGEPSHEHSSVSAASRARRYQRSAPCTEKSNQKQVSKTGEYIPPKQLMNKTQFRTCKDFLIDDFRAFTKNKLAKDENVLMKQLEDYSNSRFPKLMK